MVPKGYKFSDHAKLLGIAILQSVPNAIRKRYSSVNIKIDDLTETTFRSITIKVGGVVYVVRDYEGFRILNSDFEPFMLKWFQPRKGEVFVDVGSHVGKYAIAASKIVGDEGAVVAMEPDPSNFVVLKKNMKLNNLRNMVAFNLAAWDKQCKLQFLVGSTSANSNVDRYSYGHGSIWVQGERMDNLLIKDLCLHRVDWIKIDVEAAEYQVLLGLEETLGRFKPKLIIEVWSRNMGKVKALLDKHGYRFIRFSGFGIAQSEWFVDLLCVPNFS
jgi:FkbM family methyltransferase